MVCIAFTLPFILAVVANNFQCVDRLLSSSFLNVEVSIMIWTNGTQVVRFICPTCFQVRIEVRSNAKKTHAFYVTHTLLNNFALHYVEATLFGGDVSTWDVSNVIEIYNIFDGAVSHLFIEQYSLVIRYHPSHHCNFPRYHSMGTYHCGN